MEVAQVDERACRFDPMLGFVATVFGLLITHHVEQVANVDPDSLRGVLAVYPGFKASGCDKSPDIGTPGVELITACRSASVCTPSW
jgi:hypothetical protein